MAQSSCLPADAAAAEARADVEALRLLRLDQGRGDDARR